MTYKKVKDFLSNSNGYLKKSPLETAKAIWKKSDKSELPTTNQEVQKHLLLVKKVQKELRNEGIVNVRELFNFEETKPKRLFYDIEVSPNIVCTWNIGRKINIDDSSIIQERAIICIAYKWENERTTHCISWEDGDDRSLLEKFAPIMNSADELVGHNLDSFDTKWVRARCIFHRIPISSKFASIDTLKLARKQFRFNSNKLNYISKYLGLGQKLHTDFDMWKKITLENDTKSLNLMMKYCKKDVELLEDVYHEIENYIPVKKFKYVK